MGTGDVLILVAAVGLGAATVFLFRAAGRNERRIMQCIRQRADRVCRDVLEEGEIHDYAHDAAVAAARDLLDDAIRQGDPETIERIREAGYVWTTNGSDGSESGGVAARSVLGGIAAAVVLVPWLRRLFVIVAMALLLLFVFGGQVVMVASQIPRGDPPHVVVQTEIPTERLLQSMRDMYDGSVREAAPRDVFARRLDSLLVSHRSPSREAIASARESLLKEYPR